ncbi:hypothetical protein LCGC14_2745790 [marine sediment metagenome]|uniref:Cohesin domain-containing protein n=1 Tax=marine sediment metagenome TaxID=412755 RepID=A0A0F8Z392_9ZZZZ
MKRWISVALVVLALVLAVSRETVALERTGSYLVVLTSTPTINTGAYATGDLIGSSEISLTPAVLGNGVTVASGVIQSVVIIDEDAQEVQIDVYFFDAEPSNTTFTDNSAFAPTDADLDALIGVASVTDWKSQSTNSMGQVLNLGMPFELAVSSTTIYAVLVSRGAPTYAATGLTLRVAIFQD